MLELAVSKPHASMALPGHRTFIRMTVITGICAALLDAGAAAAAPVDITMERLFQICEATDVRAAALQGDELGWLRLSDADLSEWKTAFLKYNGGSVDVVGWRHDAADGADSLSFWVAVGPNGHQTCSYSGDHPDGILDALKKRLGSPDKFDKQDVIESTSASWKRDGREYIFQQIGSSTEVMISEGQ